jgi:hypothetical protein
LIILSAALVLLLAAAALGTAPSRVEADAPSASACAITTDASVPATPTPGNPCWTDATPYPFGADGNPVDPRSGACGPSVFPPGPSYQGDYNNDPSCYLQVTSLAFRASNRGLAAAGAVSANASTPNAFGVWLYNGTRWFPDPTFPGSSVCKGTRVLWAGKLDYWLVGGPNTWPGLCRFDGVSFTWQPLAVPQATLAHVPVDAVTGSPVNGAIKSGACLAWDDCWFFGSFGVVLHWDGQLLSDASLGFASAPWLRGDLTAAVARTDRAGNPFGFVVGNPGHVYQGQELPLPAQPDGSPPPQLFASQGGAFSALPFSPPTAPQPGDPYRTDLVAVDFDAQGDGWVAGDPTTRQPASTQPAPLVRLASAGAAAPCAGYDAGTFSFTPHGGGPGGSYLWRSLSVFPGVGDALAGAGLQPAAHGANLNDDGQSEPALVVASCGRAPTVTRFRIPDPFVADQAHAQLIPADRQGSTTAVAANALNDAWAATTNGAVVSPDPANPGTHNTRPHLYHLTDGQPPLAPAGDDYEPRPSVFTLDPPVFVEAPPVYVNPPTTSSTVTRTRKSRTRRLKPAIYGVRARLRRARDGALTLYVTFKVRRALTIGVEAMRRHTVVGSSGLKHFTGRRGELALKLDPHRWPTGIRFVTPRRRTAPGRPAG